MPLPPSPVPRQRLHLRQVSYEGWQRADGLFDIEAWIVDTKDHDYHLLTGRRAPGEPVHDMRVRVTIDHHMEVHALVACVDHMPYPGACDQIAPDYAKLVGANLMHGFRKKLFDAMGGVNGCSHLTEILAFLPTAAMQTFAGLRGEIGPNDEKPFQLDRCHALKHTSETVRRYYPKWYRGATDPTVVHKEPS
jgi:hypothetical protein